MKFLDKLKRFISNCYGIDELYYFLFYIFIILLTISFFVKNKVIWLLQFFFMIVILYRLFSNNKIKRSRENNIYLKLKNKFLKPFYNIQRSWQDKDHIYKRCYHCHTILKLPLPLKRGLKKAKCPNCHKRVWLIALRKEKIEVIRRKGRLHDD